MNIFGGSNLTNQRGERGPPGIGFKYLDRERNFDINDKRLANVSNPLENKDASNKQYVDNQFNSLNDKHSELNDKHKQLNDQYLNIVSAVTEQSHVITNNESNIKNNITKIAENLNKIQDQSEKISEELKNIQSQLLATHEEIHNELKYDIVNQEAKLKEWVYNELEQLNGNTNKKFEEYVTNDKVDEIQGILNDLSEYVDQTIENYVLDDQLDHHLEEINEKLENCVVKEELENFITDEKIKFITNEWNRINARIINKELTERFALYNSDVEKMIEKYIEQKVNPSISEIRDNVGIVQDFSTDIAINSDEIENLKVLLETVRKKLDNL